MLVENKDLYLDKAIKNLIKKIKSQTNELNVGLDFHLNINKFVGRIYQSDKIFAVSVGQASPDNKLVCGYYRTANIVSLGFHPNNTVRHAELSYSPSTLICIAHSSLTSELSASDQLANKSINQKRGYRGATPIVPYLLACKQVARRALAPVFSFWFVFLFCVRNTKEKNELLKNLSLIKFVKFLCTHSFFFFIPTEKEERTGTRRKKKNHGHCVEQCWDLFDFCNFVLNNRGSAPTTPLAWINRKDGMLCSR